MEIIKGDLSGKPEIDPTTWRMAERMRLHPIAVCCDPPDALRDETMGVWFIALVSSVPRQGERIQLEDGTFCEVERVDYSICKCEDPETRHVSRVLFPNVYAVRVELDWPTSASRPG